MSGHSPNPPSSRYSPARNQHNIGVVRQPLYLPPNSPYFSPRGSRMSSPRNSLGSPDFIPLGISSPVGRARQSWKTHNYSNNSYNSSSSTPPSSNSSFNFSPHNRNSYRGNFRRRGNFNNSGSGSPHISLYVHKDMLEDPWAELEEKLKDVQNYANRKHVSDSEETQDSAVLLDSDSDISDSDNL